MSYELSIIFGLLYILMHFKMNKSLYRNFGSLYADALYCTSLFCPWILFHNLPWASNNMPGNNLGWKTKDEMICIYLKNSLKNKDKKPQGKSTSLKKILNDEYT